MTTPAIPYAAFPADMQHDLTYAMIRKFGTEVAPGEWAIDITGADFEATPDCFQVRAEALDSPNKTVRLVMKAVDKSGPGSLEA